MIFMMNNKIEIKFTFQRNFKAIRFILEVGQSSIRFDENTDILEEN